jgi:hypothetical protein
VSGEHRLAPTAKIHDDAPYPQQAAAPTGGRSALQQGPVSYAPPSIPPPGISTPPPGSLVRPQSEPPASQFGPTPISRGPYQPPVGSNPPTSQQRPVSSPPASSPPTSQQRPVSPVSAPPRAATKPQVSSASGSFAAPPTRPLGLIVVVLLLDLGLAAAGGVLLSKGLSKEDKKPDAKSATPPVEKKAAIEAPAPAPAPGAAAVATVAAAAKQPEVTPAPVEPAAKGAAARAKPSDKAKPGEKAKALVEDKAKPSDKPVTSPSSGPAPAKTEEPKRVDGVPTQPVDPYPKTDTNQEIEAAAGASKPAFARCVAQAGEVHGSIKVALQVRSDGHVINAAAVENTTGDAELGRCLVSEVSTWRVSAHDGAAINLLRTFNYP